MGHTFIQCSERKCSICKVQGHYAVDSPLSWWRRAETAADNDDDEENLSLATAVLHRTMRPPASDPSADVPDRASPPPSSSSSSLAASSVSLLSPDAPVDVSESATAFPVTSVPASDASMDSSVPQSVDSALAPPDDCSDCAVAAAASDVSVAAAASSVAPVAALPRKQMLLLLLLLCCFPLLLLLRRFLFLRLLHALNRRPLTLCLGIEALRPSRLMIFYFFKS